MYEPILIAKVRTPRTVTIPAGGWIVLGTPEEGLAASIERRNKLVKTGNVNDDYSAVLIGRIQDTSTPTRFVTSDEAKKIKETEKAHSDSLDELHKKAKKLRADAEADTEKRRQAEHSSRLEEINRQNDSIRNRGLTQDEISEQQQELTAAANEQPPSPTANEFNREDLQTKERGELLATLDALVKAGRVGAPEKTSTAAVIEAILSAKPIPAAT